MLIENSRSVIQNILNISRN